MGAQWSQQEAILSQQYMEIMNIRGGVYLII